MTISSDRLILYTGPSPKGWHRLQTFAQCPQKFSWNYGFRGEGGGGSDNRPESEPLIKGTLVHLGLAHHYAQLRETQNGQDPRKYLDPDEAIELMCEAKGGLYAELKAPVLQTVAEYIDYWRHERFKILHVEEMIQITVAGHLFTGRLDLIVEDRDGKVWIYDHKTTGRLGKWQLRYYSMSGQILGYRWLGKAAFGERFAGMRLNFIQHKPTKFQRNDVEPAPGLLSRFPTTVAHIEKQIAELEASDLPPEHWPMAGPSACQGRFGPCEYQEKCLWSLPLPE